MSDQPTPLTADEIVQNVIRLWDQQNGWIPGGARVELAYALGVSTEDVRSSQMIQRDRVLDGIAAEGELFALLDGDGEWWLFSPYHQSWKLVSEPSSTIVAHGFDPGVAHIERSFGIAP